jgi:hypothetical protein
MSDGFGNTVSCKFTRMELSRLVEDSIRRGVLASFEIEGERLSEREKEAFLNAPVQELSNEELGITSK